jgi:methionyl-tRNA synthetase
MATFEDFKKIEMRIARIKDVQDHPNADRLYVIIVDLGGRTKQVVAGIKNHYTKESLLGREVVIADNLDPVVLRGVESQGMILATKDDNGLSVLIPEKEVAIGSLVT